MDVQLVLLRALMGMGARPQETALRPGVTLGARVLPDGGLLLAGVRVQATLPENLAPGSFVRLQVKEATTERLLLQVVDANAAPDQAAQAGATAQAAPMPTFPVLLPGPAMAHLLIDPEAEGEEGGARGGVRSTVTLRYESEGLGRVDLALTLVEGAVHAVAHAPAGEVAEKLRAASGELRTALSSALGRPAAVDIVAHAEVLDVAA